MKKIFVNYIAKRDNIRTGIQMGDLTSSGDFVVDEIDFQKHYLHQYLSNSGQRELWDLLWYED